MADKKFLDAVYNLKNTAETRALYDDWSPSYDAEVSRNGYITPTRIATALAELMPDNSQPVLDFGCGTGVSGAAMQAAGFKVLDGCDLSAEMLKQARDKRIYRKLWQADPDASFPVAAGDYAAIIAVGVISIGAAQPETMDMLVDALAPGGLFAFSFNDHTLEDARFEDRVTGYLDSGTCTQLLREDGEHLPGIGLHSTIFVLRRA